jgi:L,D-peptidoglycan transpeptidase YkuD (ErfK/YbiS/YcfS/YnhG family)
MSTSRWIVVWVSLLCVTAGAVVAISVTTGVVGNASPPATTAPIVEPLALASVLPSFTVPPPSIAPVSPSVSAHVSASVSKTAAKPHVSKAKAPAGNLASRLTTLPAGTSQVIIVHAPSASRTSVTLETFQRVKGSWVRAFPVMHAWIGADGFSDHHVEGTPNTPTGVYGFDSTFYGIDSDPGVKYGYHRVVTNDWWNENSDSSGYNTFVNTATSPGGPSEALWQQTVAYRYFAVIAYNEPAVPHRGSGVFLHVSRGRPTAGCVSLPQSDLIKVLNWLDPSKKPRIVLSTDGNLRRY